MTNNFVLFIVLLISVIFVNCAIAPDKCLEGLQVENCTLSTNTTTKQQNNDTEVTTHTAKPLDKPKALDMLAEDEHSDVPFQPTVPPTQTITNSTDEPKGRSLNFTLEEHSHNNGLLHNSSSTHDEFGDLSDVSMDNDDDSHENLNSKITTPKTILPNKSIGICEKGGLTYEQGEKLEVGCDSICTCQNGKMDCTDRCSEPFFKKGKKLDDPLCTVKDVEDHCCAILICADTETEPLEICSHDNKTYNRGEKIVKGCDEICTCEAAGKIACKPRCTPIHKTDDRCVEVPDEKDSCCKKVLCDVTLDEHEPERETEETPKLKIISAKYLNSTTIELKFDSKLDENQTQSFVELSDDKNSWKSYQILQGGYVEGFKTAVKYLRSENSDDIINIQNTELGPMDKTKEDAKNCSHKGKTYKIGDEFHDECESLCVCQESGVKCLKIECPTYFGVDVIDPNCIEWETVPPDFTPTPPDCCPKQVRCKVNGSCEYQNQTYNNWQPIPSNITGCEKRCYCEMGKVECQNICPPVTALPPANLQCPPRHASLSHLPDDDCCLYWVCNPNHQGRNQTKKSEIHTMRNETDLSSHADPFALIPTKPPSKILGPLVVYTNKDDEMLEILPNVTTDENHYYVKGNDKHSSQNILPFVPKKSDSKSKPTDSYLGPLNPNFKQTSTTTKPFKSSNKSKPNKGGLFVTPPTLPTEVQNSSNVQIPFVPPNQESIIPPSNGAHIQIHGKGNHEDILQIINQHPELANYPDGSVLEIHNIPQKPQFINPNTILPQHQQNQQIIPYVIQDGTNHPIQNQGLSLEQLLQEIHKNHPQQSTNPFIPLPPNLQYPQNNNGQIFVAQQSGSIIPTRPLHNLTYKGGIFPGAFPNVPGFQQPQEEISVHNLEAVDAHTVRLAFTVPPVIVGLHGRVEVRYTHRQDTDPSTWELQVFAPPNDLIATPQLEFDLLDLKPDTEYKIKITITLRDLHNTPSSRIYTIRTPKDIPASTMPPMIPIEPDMAITDINATWVNVVWRKFTEYELQFIDGVQLRFKEIDGKIYAATPLIHRAVTSYTLENLKPNTKYEIGIFFIPFPGQQTELHAGHMLYFTTANEIDTYGFNVTLDIAQIKATTIEIMWSGVPYPEDKYVNIYRAVYQSESGKGDYSTFKIAKRDSPAKTMIKDLKPGTRYMLWLEVYLTNGKIKTSNVQDFITKPRSAPALGSATHQDKLAAGEFVEHRGDYYGPLVIVAILAAVAILSTLILLLILVRRHSQNKAAITPPARVSQSAYDNPTYKVEIQQETMGM